MKKMFSILLAVMFLATTEGLFSARSTVPSSISIQKDSNGGAYFMDGTVKKVLTLITSGAHKGQYKYRFSYYTASGTKV